MCVEASLCVSPKDVLVVVAEPVQSIDHDPRPHQTPRGTRWGAICRIIDGDIDLVKGHALCFATTDDGLSFLYEPNAPMELTH
jgi:hypothetical protein